MASPAFKDAFTYTTTAINDTAFTVNLSIGALFSTGEISTAGETINLSDHIKTFTERCFSQDEDTNYFIQLKNIPRSTIYFYNANDEKTQFKIEDLSSLENTISEKQKKSLNVALSQIGAIDIIQQINARSKEIPIVGNPSKKTSFSLDEKGNISVEIHLFQNLDAYHHSVYQKHFPDSKYPCLHAKARVNIASNGNCDIVEATPSHPGIE